MPRHRTPTVINLFWRILAKVLARPAVADWLIARAKLTPYQHIMSADGTEMYMGRWWLFNPYSRETHKSRFWWCPWSFRIHHILREDADRDLHDHPWNARTIILRGWYTEQRLLQPDDPVLHQLLMKASEMRQSFDAAFHRNISTAIKALIRERDQLKAERDNLREDRDGLLEAGAHLL